MATPQPNETTALAAAPAGALAGPELETYQRLAALKAAIAADLNDAELQLFALVAHHSRLDPFTRQIHAVKRDGKVTFQTGIDGFRGSAEETNQYRGSDLPTFGPDLTSDSCTHPEWAEVIVHRQFPDGERLDQPARVYWAELYPGTGTQGFMWRKMPRNQLAKCAEAAAFRRAFPRRFGQVYIAEEMAQAEAIDNATPVGPTARERIAGRRHELETATEPTPTETPAALVDRLKARAQDGSSEPATDEQKAALRDALVSIDGPALAHLLGAAFALKPVGQAGGKPRFQLTAGEAQALLDEMAADAEMFIAETATLAAAQDGQQ